MNFDPTSQSRREDSDVYLFYKNPHSNTNYIIFWMCAFITMIENKILSQAFCSSIT